ncbi:MAG: hypothetical protein QG642_476 [Patescibacteria group bacterium]|nr:hypothetical protein [Patescibacteria group bacterium]
MTAHTSVGLWLTTKLVSPFWAFVIAFAMHFFLDFIPHGDSEFDHLKKTEREQKILEIKIAAIDVVFSIILVYSFFTSQIKFDNSILIAALVGSWVPDWIWMASDYMGLKFMGWYNRFHVYVHNLIGYDFTMPIGMALQLLITIFFTSLVF